MDPVPVRRGRGPRTADLAFDTEALFEIGATAHISSTPVDGAAAVVASFLASAVWKDRSQRITRRQVSDDQVAALVAALAAATDHRISDDSAAAALGVATVQLPGAFSQVQRLLNVEQYAVIRRSEGLVLLDLGLLREQFELSP